MTAPLLTHVPVAELRAVWPEIRDRVDAVARRTEEPWVSEDVFAEIIGGTAWLWGTHGMGCFVVLQVRETAYSRDLHVWIASEETDSRAADFVTQVKAIAREAACGRVTFNSPRRWQRALPGLRASYSYTFSAED